MNFNKGFSTAVEKFRSFFMSNVPPENRCQNNKTNLKFHHRVLSNTSIKLEAEVFSLFYLCHLIYCFQMNVSVDAERN